MELLIPRDRGHMSIPPQRYDYSNKPKDAHYARLEIFYDLIEHDFPVRILGSKR
jgi:hypothetical protein